MLTLRVPPLFCFFFFNDTATTEIYTLSLHDALPISEAHDLYLKGRYFFGQRSEPGLLRKSAETRLAPLADRKSTRLNSSHGYISYAVFCLKKKKPSPDASAASLTGLLGSRSNDPCEA